MSGIELLLKTLNRNRSNLISSLQLIQEQEGYISDTSVRKISDFFSLAPVEVEGVLTFYTQFKRVKSGKYIISICDGTACHIKGSMLVSNWISDALGIHNAETATDGHFSLQTVACLGCCSLAPVISINGKIFGNLDRKKLLKILRQYQLMDRND
jgi:NADH:ubiquinone oxidoreductase subunit E